MINLPVFCVGMSTVVQCVHKTTGTWSHTAIAESFDRRPVYGRVLRGRGQRRGTENGGAEYVLHLEFLCGARPQVRWLE